MELTVEKSQELGAKLKLLFGFIAGLDLEYLKAVRDGMREDCSQYAAIGILDGFKYNKRAKDKKARLKRFEALINLIEVFEETQTNILQDWDGVGDYAKEINESLL